MEFVKLAIFNIANRALKEIQMLARFVIIPICMTIQEIVSVLKEEEKIQRGFVFPAKKTVLNAIQMDLKKFVLLVSLMLLLSKELAIIAT